MTPEWRERLRAAVQARRDAEAEYDRCRRERDQLIVQAMRSGSPSRKVAELFGMTHTAVLKIVKRAET